MRQSSSQSFLKLQASSIEMGQKNTMIYDLQLTEKRTSNAMSARAGLCHCFSVRNQGA